MAERLEAAGRWLVRAGGTGTPGEVGDALGGLNANAQSALVRALRQAGLAEGPKGRLTLTPAGWARFAGLEGRPAGEVLGRVLEGWPQAHRAFVELLVSAVVARRHLARVRPKGHLAFMAIGETGTGKTAMGALVCTLFGLDPVAHTLYVPAQTPGQLLGVTVQDGDGFRWEPAPVTRQPFVVLDEFDKASDDAARRRALVLLHDEVRVQLAGRVHELAPTALLLANPAPGDRYRMLRPEYRRRSAVLDTAGTHGIEDVVAATFAGLEARPADRLDLEALVPPADRLPAEMLDTLRSLRDVALTQAGRDEFPGVAALEAAALGRWALLGPDAEPGAAVLGTAIAYLQVTGTVPGMVNDEAYLDLAAVRAALGEGGDAIAAAIERGRAERDAAHEQVRHVRRRRAAADLEVVAGAATLAAELRQVHDALDGRRLPEALRAPAAGQRAVLRQLAAHAGKVSTRAALDEAQEAAVEPLRRGRELLAQANATRLEQTQYARDERQRQRREQAAQRAEAARLRAGNAAERRWLADELAAIVATAAPLEALYKRTTTRPGEDVLGTLQGLRVDGRPVVRYLSALPAPDQPRKGWRRLLADHEPGGLWCSTLDAGVRYYGTRYGCTDLRAWGSGTRSVLAPPLRLLHASENHLRERLGRRPRAARPQVLEPPRKPTAQLPPAPARKALPAAPAPVFPVPAEVLQGASRYGLPSLEARPS